MESLYTNKMLYNIKCEHFTKVYMFLKQEQEYWCSEWRYHSLRKSEEWHLASKARTGDCGSSLTTGDTMCIRGYT